MLNVIRRVLENVDHVGGLFNHSTLLGICQIVSIFSIHNLLTKQFLFKRDLLNLLNWRFCNENRVIQKTFVWYCIWFYSQKKKWGKNKNIFKQIPSSTHYQLFSLRLKHRVLSI